MNILSLLRQSFRDFFSPKILLITCLPSLLGLVFWGSVLFAYGDDVRQYVLSFFPHWLTDGTREGLLNSSFSFLISLALSLIFLCLILLGNILAAPFYSPLIIAHIRTRFPHLPRQGFGSLFESLGYFLKLASLLGVLCVLCIPLYFIPIIGPLILFVLGFIFFQKTMFFDIGSEIMNKEQFASFQQTQRVKNHTIALIAYIWSFIPVLNFFLMPLQILILAHYLFARLDAQHSQNP